MRNNKAVISANALLQKALQTGQLSQSVLEKIERGQLIAEDRTIYVRTKLGGAGNPATGGISQLITDALDALTGQSNITKGKLPEDNPFIIEAIRLGYGLATAASKTATEVTYKYVEDHATCPAALRNADFVVRQNGGALITAQVCDILSGAKHQDSHSEAGMQLKNPKIVKPNERLDFNLEIPSGLNITSSGNDVFIEFAIIGTIYRNKAAA